MKLRYVIDHQSQITSNTSKYLRMKKFLEIVGEFSNMEIDDDEKEEIEDTPK